MSSLTTDQVIVVSKVMKKIYKTALSYAQDSDAAVLITGETGVGKDLIARYIHEHSGRAKGPFVSINCGAIPLELAENEFFGHAKGAFTGATQNSQGVFQSANGGVLFLDEIGDMSYALQSKLLRVLQEKAFSPLGNPAVVKTDVRIIAATNQQLEEAVKKKRFRKDLFYRLDTLRLHIPPLRERREDIRALVEYFRKQCKQVPQFDEEALTLLESFSWPGNVREVKNLVEALSALYPNKAIKTKEVLDFLERLP